MATEKIVPVEILINLVFKLKQEGKKVIYAHGAFDLLHAGHIHHLEEAKKLGDILVVTVTADAFIEKGPGRPRFKEGERLKFISSLSCVDFVALNETAYAVETIRKMRPDIYVKGRDVKEKAEDSNEGLSQEIKAIKEAGGEIYFIESLPIHSTELLNRYFSAYSNEINDFLDKFARKYPFRAILETLEKVKKLKVLVIGDAIIDQYQYVSVTTKSPKSNHLVTRGLNEDEFAGGVMACANHIAEFCETVRLVTCLGSLDSKENFIREHLKDNISPYFVYRPDAPTTSKKRFVEPTYLTKLFEVNFLEDSDLPREISEELCQDLGKTIGEYDLVLVADYGHGFLNDDIVRFLSEKAKFLAIDVQANSANFGFNLVTKYPRADYVCIDEPEIRLAAHSRTGDLKPLIKKISHKVKADRISITRGHNGCMTFLKGEGFKEVPVLSTIVVDTVGAGDAFFSASSPWAAIGAPMELVGFIGNIGGAIKVGTLCNQSAVGLKQLRDFVERLLMDR